MRWLTKERLAWMVTAVLAALATAALVQDPEPVRVLHVRCTYVGLQIATLARGTAVESWACTERGWIRQAVLTGK